MGYEIQGPAQADGLADVLERILDKGVVIAGDVSVSLVGIELLTIRLRLLIATVDKAKEMGINWWENDPRLTAQASTLEAQNSTLLERISALEAKLAVQKEDERPELI
ncbi:gas vesicle protein GvpJ [Cognatiyoonia sp. IB215446]|nr:gas vesicle protein GvpJ [Cognatiyoonia sp. IB215446]MDX8348473.1 gas vesicle protein GvpJ [Cognatiyoonia sp. IB215446]